MAYDEKHGDVVDVADLGLDVVYDSSKDAQCNIWGVKYGNHSINKNKVTNNAQWTGYTYWSFGNDAIGSVDSEEIAVWEFQVDQHTSGYFDFGIASNPQGIINAGNINHSSQLPGKYYCVFGHDGRLYSHKAPGSLLGATWSAGGCRTGDKITMQLNCQKKTLSVWKNGTFIGVLFENIEFDNSIKGYYFAIGPSYTNDVASILKYQRGKGFPSMKNDLKKITKFYENGIQNGTKLMYLLAKNQQNSKNNTDNRPQKEDNKEELSFDMIVKISQEIGNYNELIPAIEKKHDELCKILKQITQCHSDICKPDIKKYNEWELNEIIFWIMSLENGRYQKYIEKLKQSFKENQISGQDLPHLTRQDLHVSFGINVFRDRMDLEKHFQKLSNDEGM